MTTATDVLRFIAVLSGTDGSLQREPRLIEIERSEIPGRRVRHRRGVAHGDCPFQRAHRQQIGGFVAPRLASHALDQQRASAIFALVRAAENGQETDLDLSVGLFDDAWRQVGVCSYDELQSTLEDGTLIAQSSGDLRDAPWPDGASEFVDVHIAAPRSAGARYAVMVVNAYAGMPFSQLERGFAGLMLSESPMASHFDPKAVELKFDLAGENGIYLMSDQNDSDSAGGVGMRCLCAGSSPRGRFRGAAAGALARRGCLGQRRAASQVVRACAESLVSWRGTQGARHLLGPLLPIRSLEC